MDYLVQHGRKAYWQMLDLTNKRHAEYARRHGMSFISHRGPIVNQWTGHWDMIPLLLYFIRRPNTGYVFWLDADTVICKDADMRDVLNGHKVGMSRHPGPPEHYNCGVLFLQACKEVETWLGRVLDLGPGIYPWYQQNLMNEHIGMVGKVKTLPHEWNSTVVLRHPEDCIIRAWHGSYGGISRRLSLMRDFIATL